LEAFLVASLTSNKESTMTYRVDSNTNIVLTARTSLLDPEGDALWVVRLVSEPDRGYIVAVDQKATVILGTDECPSSYGAPCLTWFGPGERYGNVGEALEANCAMDPRCSCCAGAGPLEQPSSTVAAWYLCAKCEGTPEAEALGFCHT
jgi:hypothetical protein